jgi:hypothetical protein
MAAVFGSPFIPTLETIYTYSNPTVLLDSESVGYGRRNLTSYVQAEMIVIVVFTSG